MRERERERMRMKGVLIFMNSLKYMYLSARRKWKKLKKFSSETGFTIL